MNKTQRERLGFIGLGVMGEPMVGHLIRAGYDVAVYDVDAVVCQRVAAAHASVSVMDTPAALGAAADVVITMLPDGEVVARVATGPDGLIEGMQPGSLLLDTSSSQPWLTKQTAGALGVRDIAMVDAAVSGAQWGAEGAELVFMVGGTEADVARIQPLLEVMGRKHVHLGPLGAGHLMKCINNTITAMTFIATSEGLSLGSKLGLDPAAMNDVLNEATGGSWITRNHIEQRVLSRTFDDPFRLALMTKDVGIALNVAAQAATPMPLSHFGSTIYQAALETFGPTASLSLLARYIELQAKTEINGC